MTVQAIDATGLSLAQIKDLRAQGVKYFGRYLSKSTWKGLSLEELSNIKQEGGEVFSIYETNPTHASYFSFAQGQADASSAVDLANTLKQPAESAIYFTVDYDAQPRDFSAIVDYFKGVKSKLSTFKVGAYGSFAVLTELHTNSLADFYFQTVAWSRGSKAPFLHIYQAVCNTTLAGVSVDTDEVLAPTIGSWGQSAPAPKPVAPLVPPLFCKNAQVIAKIQSVANNDIRKAPSHKAEFVRNTVANENFDAYERVTNENDTWWGVGGTNWICSNGGENVKVLSYVNMPTPTPAPVTPKPAAPPAPVAPPVPAETHVNFIITELKGNSLGNLHEYIAAKGWWFAAVEEKDSTFTIETGIFIQGSPSYNNFKDFLDTEKFSYSTKAPQ